MSSPEKKTDKSIFNTSNIEIADKMEYFKKEFLKTSSINNNFINNNNTQIEVDHTRKITESNSNDTNDKTVKKLKSLVCYICLSTTCLKAFCPKLKAKEKISSLLPTPRNPPTTATKVQKATTPSSTTLSSTKQSPTTPPPTTPPPTTRAATLIETVEIPTTTATATPVPTIATTDSSSHFSTPVQGMPLLDFERSNMACSVSNKDEGWKRKSKRRKDKKKDKSTTDRETNFIRDEKSKSRKTKKKQKKT
uniref:Uncharacterized protein n=1 Tax=Octopus bimaculoides TaxID=37653 RepID=A0A0L8HIB1_OCTBM